MRCKVFLTSYAGQLPGKSPGYVIDCISEDRFEGTKVREQSSINILFIDIEMDFEIYDRGYPDYYNLSDYTFTNGVAYA